MGKKNKKQKVLQVTQANIGEESSDEGPTPMKKRVLRPVSSDSEEEPINSRRELRKRRGSNEDVATSSKKRKMLRCRDSSDEENVENSSVGVATPKAERVNKLLEMQKKIQAKKKVSYDDTDSTEDENWLEEDEESLPMWEHEEAPPEDVPDDSESEGNMDDFIVNDEEDVEIMTFTTKGKKKDEDSDNDHHDLSDAEQKILEKKRKNTRKSKLKSAPEDDGKSRPVKNRGKIEDEDSDSTSDQDHSDAEQLAVKKKCKKTRRSKVESASEAEQEAEESGEEEEQIGKRRRKQNRKVWDSEDDESSESSGEEIDYGNPYMQMDHALENANIIDLLSKNTDKDKKNAKKYRKEMGKYQYAVHSDRNKAAQVSNRARFAANMGTVKADRGFKAERNLDIKDSEYHDYQESCLFGERVRIFPHTKKYSKYKSRCALRGCGEPFSVGETRIIGVTKFSDINFQFMKKVNNFGKEGFYYICERHCPKTGSDSEGYTSGED